MTGYRIETAKSALTRHETIAETLEPAAGEVIARLDRAAITANNVTYAVHHGPPLHYGRFFPAASPDTIIVPLWGFGTVTASRAEGVAEGSRFYGYWPSASHVRLLPSAVKRGGFADTAAHRQGLADVYNSYTPATDLAPSPADEPFSALFRPLFGTAFALDDELAGGPAATLILTSASSKTALGTAFLLRQRPGLAVIGLTSAANEAFTRATGCYDRVLPYDALETLDPAVPCVLVDFSGNGPLKARLHGHLAGLVASHNIGDTHWAEPHAESLPGPTPSWFFAPTTIADMVARDGVQTFQANLAAGFDHFRRAASWLRVQEVTGPDGYASAFDPLVTSGGDPAVGMIWRP
jgi:hypothetical protein